MARRSESVELPLDLIGDFPSEWERSTLEKACSLVTDGTHDSPKETTTGFPLVTGKCITGGRINLGVAYLISEADHRAVIARSRPEFGDVLFANIGNSIGELARVETDTEFSIKNVALFKPGPRLDSRFLKYYLLAPPVQSYVRTTTFGSAQPFIGLGTLRGFPIPLPPLSEQRAIAHILGTLDEKIELNRRMSETLEAMARALFKSWFVDFDPVRAKMEGRDPALPKHIADLFPDRLVDSELGEIPEGWEVKAISDLADVVGGSTPSTKEPAYWEGPHYWATPKDLSALAFPVLLDTERRITDVGLERISSALLPVGTVLLSSRAPIGYLAIAEIPVAINQGFIAMRPQRDVSNLFLLQWAREAHETILSNANGSTFLEISKKNFRPIPTVAPPTIVMEVFDRVARQLYDRLVANERESRTLADLRNALLPMLISGELRVPDVAHSLASTPPTVAEVRA